MLRQRRPWQEELAIIDRTMKAISGVIDPEELVETYWTGVGELISIDDYVALSRRDMTAPYYLITRSSRFPEHLNPWTQRDRLPRMSGGLLGDIIYGNQPLVIDDLPSRLSADDPARFYLEGFQSLVALPQYDSGEGAQRDGHAHSNGLNARSQHHSHAALARRAFRARNPEPGAAKPAQRGTRHFGPGTENRGGHPAFALAQRAAVDRRL